MSSVLQETNKIRYVYDLGASADGAPPAPCSARVDVATAAGELHGVSVCGGHAQVALRHAARGSARALEAGKAEMFYYVLSGSLRADIDGAVVAVPAMQALHVPAGMPHALYAADDVAMIVVAAVPAEGGSVGGAAAAWSKHAVAMQHPTTRASGAHAVRYVYAIDELDQVPAGLGSAAYMSAELFKSMAKLEMVHISYKGAGPALIDLLGGHLDLLFPAILSSAPYHKAGRLRGLGVTSPRRHPSLPEIPTIAEAALPG